jgi:hypothetical protein
MSFIQSFPLRPARVSRLHGDVRGTESTGTAASRPAERADLGGVAIVIATSAATKGSDLRNEFFIGSGMSALDRRRGDTFVGISPIARRTCR